MINFSKNSCIYDLLSLALDLGRKQGNGNITIIISKDGLEAIWSKSEVKTRKTKKVKSRKNESI